MVNLNRLKNNASYGSAPYFEEWFKSVIELSKSSYGYWKASGLYPVTPVQKGVIGDAAGFLAGWASAAIGEINDHGHLSISNQNNRMLQGFTWGVLGSVSPGP